MLTVACGIADDRIAALRVDLPLEAIVGQIRGA
jgi:hypothetical protein